MLFKAGGAAVWGVLLLLLYLAAVAVNAAAVPVLNPQSRTSPSYAVHPLRRPPQHHGLVSLVQWLDGCQEGLCTLPGVPH